MTSIIFYYPIGKLLLQKLFKLILNFEMSCCRFLICCLILLFSSSARAQQIVGKVTTLSNEPLVGATVVLKDLNKYAQVDIGGNYIFSNLPNGEYICVAYLYGYETVYKSIEVKGKGKTQLNFVLRELQDSLKTVVVETQSSEVLLARLNAVDGMGIYEAKKTELILLKDVTANLATNNARQIYGKVAGLNVWESDGAGIQLGIGARGLSPNRTAHFNVRQNGYDISADALGYPESYYTPPVEAVERIEVVRGAASLQYGTQFGGMLNFVLRDAPENKKASANIRQTIGSFGFLNSFLDVGGNLGKDNKLSYYGFYQYKRGDGWRENSGFDVHTGMAKLTYRPSSKLSIAIEYTGMNYIAQQAGGLTDNMFEQNPRQSMRERNWFAVNWNLAALTLDYQISPKTQVNSRTFGLYAGRRALGNLDKISVIDFNQNRTFIDGLYENFGNETRLLHRYSFSSDTRQTHAFVVGTRYYNGLTTQRQGDGDSGKEANFNFLNPENPENSSYRFPNQNASFFLENIFNINEKWSITPGIRGEWINTKAEGYYNERAFDFAGNLISQVRNEESLERPRSFLLGGIGVSYKPLWKNSEVEFYGNFSQNFRSVTFSDLRIQNPNLVVSPDIKDETGYNADLGFRGNIKEILHFDISAFHLNYNDRISQVEKSGEAPLFLPYRFRGNIAQARIWGIESLIEAKIADKWLRSVFPQTSLRVFLNTAILDSRYVEAEETAIKDKKVELVPPLTIRTGLQIAHRSFRLAYQYAYTHKHFTDATNVVRSATAVSGIIPSYGVMDVSLTYKYKWLIAEASVNNLTDNMYFTRRADGYPGPGIIPADGRAFFLTLGANF